MGTHSTGFIANEFWRSKIAVGSRSLAMTGNVFVPFSSKFSLPYEAIIFKKAMAFTLAVALIGFSICFALYGTIFYSDLVGVLMAGPVFAYLAHLLYLVESHR